jgi:hypothetical protein
MPVEWLKTGPNGPYCNKNATKNWCVGRADREGSAQQLPPSNIEYTGLRHTLMRDTTLRDG